MQTDRIDDSKMKTVKTVTNKLAPMLTLTDEKRQMREITARCSFSFWQKLTNAGSKNGELGRKTNDLKERPMFEKYASPEIDDMTS